MVGADAPGKDTGNAIIDRKPVMMVSVQSSGGRNAL